MKRQLPAILAAATFFSLCVASAQAGVETILYNFQMTGHGQYPSGGLISDAAGNLYGITEYGGAYDDGAVFMLSPNAKGGWKETILYSFKGEIGGGKDGWYPTGALTFDSAGNLYGATTWGGNSTDKVGTIFKLAKTETGWEESVIWSFQQFNTKDGFNPQGGLIFDKLGNLYGTTEYGGGYTQNGCSYDGGCGTVFQLSPKSHGKWKETILYVFQGEADGEFPNDTLAIGASGNLYGTTRAYTNSSGTVFQVTPNAGGSWTETTIYSFTGGADGDAPSGGLIFDGSGNLDGTTLSGGSSSACVDSSPCGTVFQLVPSTNGLWNEKVLYSFNNTDGAGPTGKLIIDQSGNLEGMTEGGGTSNEGTAFKLTLNSGGSWTESVLFNFTGPTGGLYPQYGVIAGTSGELYGVEAPFVYSTGSKNGIIFQLAQNTQGQWSETILDSFPDADGGLPIAGVIADSAGNLYGTTSRGGGNGYGTVFELIASSGWKEKTLYNFTSGDVGTELLSNPSVLIFDSGGNLYGETLYGGAEHDGIVFELSPGDDGNWIEKTLFTFSAAATGIHPSGGLVLDSAGNLYGTTKQGGIGCNQGCGIVFKLSPTQGYWQENILYSFAGGSDGSQSAAGVIFDSAGNLYGTTLYGGFVGYACGYGCGTVFKLTPQAGGTWTKSLVYEFLNAQGDGETPGGVIFDETGNLYGSTFYGGNHGPVCGTDGCGIAYKLSPGSGNWVESVLYTFDGSVEAFPNGGLVFDASGNLYGTTEGGLYGLWGSVFELSPRSGGHWNENTLYSFGAPGTGDGYLPEACVILGQSGNLYGTTAGGGQENWGTVFQITP